MGAISGNKNDSKVLENPLMIKLTQDQTKKGLNSLTENGALSHDTTMNDFLDAYFKFIRNVNKKVVFDYLDKMFSISPVDATIMIFQTRDIEEGKGERKIFRNCLAYMIKNHYDIFEKVMYLVCENNYGRYDDLIWGYYLYLYNFYEIRQSTDMKRFYKEHPEVIKPLSLICKYYYDILVDDVNKMNVEEPVSLCAKWFISENTKLDRRLKFTKMFIMLMKKQFNIHINHKVLRQKYITPLRTYIDIVEKVLTTKNYDHLTVDYLSKIPSCAMNKLKNKLTNISPEWEKYRKSLVKDDGEAKINVKTLYPHDIIRNYVSSGWSCSVNSKDDIIEKQWMTKVDEIRKKNCLTDSLFMCDTSGSMFGDDAILVSLALSLLGTELSSDKWKDYLITFNNDSHFVKVPNSYDSLHRTLTFLLDTKKFPWGGSTNFQSAFDNILEKAVSMKLEQTDMPKYLWVISDMQFDSSYNEQTNFESIKEKYAESGYVMPSIIFWNVRANTKDFPVTKDENGVILLAGSSPSVMKYVFSGKVNNPIEIIREILVDKRYEPVRNVLV